MQRLRRAAFPIALAAAIAIALVAVVGDSAADLENGVFTSRPDHLRLVVPRGWRASEQPSYPGLVLWMANGKPPGQIVVATERFDAVAVAANAPLDPQTRALYCSWPAVCRASHDGLAARYACALRAKLEAERLRVGPVQAGPKENEAAGVPSVWFEYEDGRHYLRHAIAFSPDRAISIVLSAPTNDARITHTRAFEQALRTMHRLTEEETARATWIDAGPDDAPADARAGDGPPPASATARPCP
jgi:hypothetical protein